jgi:hypothetical protein
MVVIKKLFGSRTINKNIKDIKEFDEFFNNYNPLTEKLPYGINDLRIYRSVIKKVLDKTSHDVKNVNDLDLKDESYLLKELNNTFLTNKNSQGSSLVLIGSSKSGKTTFLYNLIKSIKKQIKEDKDINKCYYINFFSFNASTESYDKFHKIKNLKDKFYINIYNSVIKLNEIIDIEKASYDDFKKEKLEIPYFINIFDDVVSEKNNKLLLESITTLRNINISTILSLQDPILLSKTNRGNINHTLFFKLNNSELIENAFKTFLNSSSLDFNNKKEKIDFYKNNIINYKKLYYSPLNNIIYMVNDK